MASRPEPVESSSSAESKPPKRRRARKGNSDLVLHQGDEPVYIGATEHHGRFQRIVVTLMPQNRRGAAPRMSLSLFTYDRQTDRWFPAKRNFIMPVADGADLARLLDLAASVVAGEDTPLEKPYNIA